MYHIYRLYYITQKKSIQSDIKYTIDNLPNLYYEMPLEVALLQRTFLHCSLEILFLRFENSNIVLI